MKTKNRAGDIDGREERSPRAVGEIQRQIAASEYLIVYDLETTGFNPLCDRIIEFAAIRYRQTDGILEENGKLHKYFRLPNGMTLPDEVSKLTGITYEKLAKEPQEADCIEDILFFIEDDPLIGYNNLHFDDLFLKQLFYRNAVQYNPQKTFDVFHMAHDFVGKIENYKLMVLKQSNIIPHFQMLKLQQNYWRNLCNVFRTEKPLYSVATRSPIFKA